MASRTSQLVELIKTGSAEDVERFLSMGYTPPKTHTSHPILELFYAADPKYPSARELDGKLKAFLKYGLDPDWALPRDTPQSKATRYLVSAGLPQNSRGEVAKDFTAASLLARSAGCGRVDMVELLLAYGADPWKDRHAIKCAYERNQPNTMLALTEAMQQQTLDPKQWGKNCVYVVRCAHKNQAPYLLRSWEKMLPVVFNVDTKKDLFGDISKSGQDHKAIAYWMLGNPDLFHKIHTLDMPSDSQVAISFWPQALRLASREGPKNAFFQMALSTDPAWMHTNVSAEHWRVWETGPGKSGAWVSERVCLPPLQTLLHIESQHRDSLFNVVRTAKALIKRGAMLWVGADAPENSPTEAMLWAASYLGKPPVKWFQKRPEWIAPHPKTGHDAFKMCTRVDDANFWIEAGGSLSHCDQLGNQSMAALLSRCQHTNSNIHGVSGKHELAKWAIEGWQNRDFPTQGMAYEQSMSEWATFNITTHKAHARMTREQPNPDDLLRASLRNLNVPLSVQLIESGANPFVPDASGWNGITYLGRWAKHNYAQKEQDFVKIGDALGIAENPFSFGQNAMRHNGPDAWGAMIAPCFIQSLTTMSVSGWGSTFFETLHRAKKQDPTLWKWEDSNQTIAIFSNEFKEAIFKDFIDGLSSEILDDLILALFNPARWSEDITSNKGFVRYGQQMARTLFAEGANLMGRDLRGTRLDILLPLAKKASEDNMTPYAQSEEKTHSVMHLSEALANYESLIIRDATQPLLSPPRQRRIRI